MSIIREQLQNNANKGQFFLKVDMDDLNNFDEQLSMSLRTYPSDYITIVISLR
jgi:MCM N-terminal domain